MKKTFLYSIAGIVSLFIMYACSATKYIPEGEYLLDKVKIESDVPDYDQFDLKPYLKQQPNTKMFGLNKTMFQIYNLSGKNDKRWYNRLLKKIGEEPVIFDSTLVEKTDSEFEKLFINKGYINVDVDSKIITHNQKAEVVYKITGNEPYRIREYEQTVIADTLTLPPSLVRPGMLFDRNILDQERKRISRNLRDRGFYAFNEGYITYNADSALNSNAVDVELLLHPPGFLNTKDTTAGKHHQKYYLNNVSVYLNYDPLQAEQSELNSYTQKVHSNGYDIYYKGKKPSIRPRTITGNSFLRPDVPYSQTREDLTYASLTGLSALNNTQIQFTEFTRNDSSFLDCTILTIPAKKQTVSLSVEGTNTQGDLGIASSVSYTHRNLFRGSETFNFKVRGAYEAISYSSSYWEFGGEASIHVPKFIFPFINRSFLRRKKTSTEFSFSYNYQTRPEYDRTILSSGLRYIWQGRERLTARHQFDLLDIDYVYLPRIDAAFLATLPASAEFFGYKDQFIVGSGYSFQKTTYDPMQKQRNAYSFRFSIESAGNVLQTLSKLTGQKKNENGTYDLLNTNFAQFIRGNFDYARTTIIDRQNSFAWRIGGGIGFPYGNSKELPFEKRYYSGGANSVRGWSVRELGPGSYKPTATSNFFHQSGDIKLDMSIEYRTRFFWKLETAAFIDAGNIWTIKDYEDQEGGQFQFDSFFKEIALAYGLGLRFDFDFFLIRCDMGWKAYDPSKDGRKKWAITNPNFSSNFAWHIAVGYPF